MSTGVGIYPLLRRILSKFRIQSVRDSATTTSSSSSFPSSSTFRSSSALSSPSPSSSSSAHAVSSSSKPHTLSSIFPIDDPSPFAPLTVQIDYPIHLEETEENRRSQEIANMQAPNRPIPWSSGQASRHEAMTGPRFGGIDFTKQPRPDAAIAFVDAEPVQWVHGRKVACDGVGALGHPKVYINLDRNVPMSCMYCGKKFQQSHDHGHH